MIKAVVKLLIVVIEPCGPPPVGDIQRRLRGLHSNSEAGYIRGGVLSDVSGHV